MKFAMIGAVLITLPAIAALVYGVVVGNTPLVYAALASFLINTLPFIAAGLMLGKSDSSDLGH